MKTALVLSGGGAKGAFQVGALDYLINEKKVNFEFNPEKIRQAMIAGYTEAKKVFP